MALSRLPQPLINVAGKYLQELYCNPVRTKAVTSCIIASLGNLTSQIISGSSINEDSIISFGLFGLLFGGTLPHYFYNGLDRLIPGGDVSASLLKLLIERIIYTPLYQLFALYTLARLEGKSHNEANAQVYKLYWSVLQANWKYLTSFHIVNITLVPRMLRVLVVNIIGFFWSVYLSEKRKRGEKCDKEETS